MKTIVLIVCMSMVAGCAPFQARLAAMKANSTPGSYVAPEISASDANEVAMDIAQFLSVQLPPAKTTLDLQLSKTSFHAMLVDKLMGRGFGIVQSKAQPEHEQAMPLRYTITPLDKGVLVRLRYGGHAATRYLPRGNDGHLSLQNKYAVRSAQ